MPVAAVLPRPAPTAAPAPTFTIGELAREFGVTTRAIRFYEDCGLLEPARAAGTASTARATAPGCALTLRGKRLGLKLAEVKELVDMYETRRDTGPQLRRFLGVLARHRAQLEQRLGDLQATLAEVTAQEEEARRLLGHEERDMTTQLDELFERNRRWAADDRARAARLLHPPARRSRRRSTCGSAAPTAACRRTSWSTCCRASCSCTATSPTSSCTPTSTACR